MAVLEVLAIICDYIHTCNTKLFLLWSSFSMKSSCSFARFKISLEYQHSPAFGDSRSCCLWMPSLKSCCNEPDGVGIPVLDREHRCAWTCVYVHVNAYQCLHVYLVSFVDPGIICFVWGPNSLGVLLVSQDSLSSSDLSLIWIFFKKSDCLYIKSWK